MIASLNIAAYFRYWSRKLSISLHTDWIWEGEIDVTSVAGQWARRSSLSCFQRIRPSLFDCSWVNFLFPILERNNEQCRMISWSTYWQLSRERKRFVGLLEMYMSDDDRSDLTWRWHLWYTKTTGSNSMYIRREVGSQRQVPYPLIIGR